MSGFNQELGYFWHEYMRLIDNIMQKIEDEDLNQWIREELVRIDEEAEKAREGAERKWWSGRSFYLTREEFDKEHKGV